jgi:HK97 gp10 family phage protein
MSITVKIEGFADLEKALGELEKLATQKAVARRSLKAAAEPLARLAKSLAPDDPATSGFDLAASIKVGNRLSRSQTRQHRKMFRNDRAAVEMFVGAGPLPQAVQQEFGNINHGPQPFMRPAWEQDQRALLDRLKAELWADIQKTVERAARRAARLAAKG